MDSQKPAKKRSYGSLGWILISGGGIILYRAGEMEKYFDRLGEGGSVSWAIPLGTCMILAGLGCWIPILFKFLSSDDRENG